MDPDWQASMVYITIIRLITEITNWAVILVAGQREKDSKSHGSDCQRERTSTPSEAVLPSLWKK